MKINFSAPIRDIKGDPMKDEKGAAFTLGDAAATALLAQYPDEKDLDAKSKVARFTLAALVVNGGEHDLETEDVALIKQTINKGYNALVVGRAYEIIEAKPA